MTERILHIALRTPSEGQPGLARALRRAAKDYDEVDWTREMEPVEMALYKTRTFKPTLVFMQIQRAGAFQPFHIEAMRELAGPDAVIVNWDGDQHHEPSDPARRWFVELGKVCDASLVVNTRHPAEYGALGVKNPGYLQIGIDPELYRPTPVPGAMVTDVVFLGSRYETHHRRNAIIERVAEALPGRFTAYGSGWGDRAWGQPMLAQYEEAAVYTAAGAALCMSIRNDLPAYTSDRLFRALGSGAACFVERFPGVDDVLGVMHGIQAVIWDDPEDLACTLKYWLSGGSKIPLGSLRKPAAELVRTTHTWDARMPELLEIAERIRAERAGK